MSAKAQRARKPAARGYGLAEAKARLSEVVARAQSEGPQEIRMRGKPVAVVVSAQEWERRTRPAGTLWDFFRNAPLRGSGVRLERPRGGVRDAAL